MNTPFRRDRTKPSVILFDCPGCQCLHAIHTSKQETPDYPEWSWNGDLEKATFSPSLLVRTGKYVPGHENFDDEGHPELNSICHSFITDGQIRFLDDCTHHLKGQTVEVTTRKSQE